MKAEIVDMQTGEVREVEVPDELAKELERFLDRPEEEPTE